MSCVGLAPVLVAARKEMEEWTCEQGSGRLKQVLTRKEERRERRKEMDETEKEEKKWRSRHVNKDQGD